MSKNPFFDELSKNRAALFAAIDSSTAMTPFTYDLRKAFEPPTRAGKIEFAIHDLFRALPNRPSHELVSVMRKRLTRAAIKYGLDEVPCDKTIRKYINKKTETERKSFPNLIVNAGNLKDST